MLAYRRAFNIGPGLPEGKTIDLTSEEDGRELYYAATGVRLNEGDRLEEMNDPASILKTTEDSAKQVDDLLGKKLV